MFPVSFFFDHKIINKDNNDNNTLRKIKHVEGVNSCIITGLPNSGKTLLALNFAISAASSGKYVLLCCSKDVISKMHLELLTNVDGLILQRIETIFFESFVDLCSSLSLIGTSSSKIKNIPSVIIVEEEKIAMPGNNNKTFYQIETYRTKLLTILLGVLFNILDSIVFQIPDKYETINEDRDIEKVPDYVDENSINSIKEIDNINNIKDNNKGCQNNFINDFNDACFIFVASSESRSNLNSNKDINVINPRNRMNIDNDYEENIARNVSNFDGDYSNSPILQPQSLLLFPWAVKSTYLLCTTTVIDCNNKETLDSNEIVMNNLLSDNDYKNNNCSHPILRKRQFVTIDKVISGIADSDYRITFSFNFSEN